MFAKPYKECNSIGDILERVLADIENAEVRSSDSKYDPSLPGNTNKLKHELKDGSFVFFSWWAFENIDQLKELDKSGSYPRDIGTRDRVNYQEMGSKNSENDWEEVFQNLKVAGESNGVFLGMSGWQSLDAPFEREAAFNQDILARYPIIALGAAMPMVQDKKILEWKGNSFLKEFRTRNPEPLIWRWTPWLPSVEAGKASADEAKKEKKIRKSKTKEEEKKITEEIKTTGKATKKTAKLGTDVTKSNLEQAFIGKWFDEKSLGDIRDILGEIKDIETDLGIAVFTASPDNGPTEKDMFLFDPHLVNVLNAVNAILEHIDARHNNKKKRIINEKYDWIRWGDLVNHLNLLLKILKAFFSRRQAILVKLNENNKIDGDKAAFLIYLYVGEKEFTAEQLKKLLPASAPESTADNLIKATFANNGRMNDIQGRYLVKSLVQKDGYRLVFPPEFVQPTEAEVNNMIRTLCEKHDAFIKNMETNSIARK